VRDGVASGIAGATCRPCASSSAPASGYAAARDDKRRARRFTWSQMAFAGGNVVSGQVLHRDAARLGPNTSLGAHTSLRTACYPGTSRAR
jgi:hypothetical protein